MKLQNDGSQTHKITSSVAGFSESNNVTNWFRIAKVSRGSFLKFWSTSSLFSIVVSIAPSTLISRETKLPAVSATLPSKSANLEMAQTNMQLSLASSRCDECTVHGVVVVQKQTDKLMQTLHE